MQVKTDLRNGKGLQIFLEDLGFTTWWDGNGILNILTKDGKSGRLAKSICSEYRKTGWIPYHYALHPSKRGKVFSGEKVEFTGKAVEIAELRNMLGTFSIVLFEGEDGNNYVWKSYTSNLPTPERKRYSARPVCQLRKGGKILNLINYVRGYEIKESN